MHNLRSLIVFVAALFFAGVSVPAEAGSSCDATKDYVLGGTHSFVCDAGWQNPIVAVEGDVAGQPCYSVTLTDPYTLEVDLPIVCLSEALDLSVAIAGHITVISGSW